MKKYGLIGYPLLQSASPDYFNAKFKAEGIDARYDLYPLADLKDLKDLLSDNPDLVGLNVTTPHKTAVLEYLDDLDEEAEKIGAVNVIRIDRGGLFGRRRLIGYNSDQTGFGESIRSMLRAWEERALILGTGGAARAVDRAFHKIGIASTFVSRHPTAPNMLSYKELTPETLKHYTIIVQATPLGSTPDTTSFPPIPYEGLTEAHICYDLNYRPEVTAFMRKAEAEGAEVVNGAHMLVLQALESYRIWTEED